MINALELYRQIKGQWDTTNQPLKERASVLPLGQYEDGSVGLAWPQLLAAPAEGVANFGQYGYGEEAVPYNTRMAFDAAGGAMTGAGPAHIATAMTAKKFPVGGMADDAGESAWAYFAKSNSPGQTNEYLSNLYQNLQEAEANFSQLSKGREGWQKAYAQRAKADADRFRKLIAEAESPGFTAGKPEVTNQKMLFEDVPQAYAQSEPPRIEAVPFSGDPIQAFRGQRSAENVFNWSPGTRADPETSYWWGSSSPEVASTYADNRQGSVVVPSELRFRNPLEIDVGGNEGLFVPWKGGFKTTEQVADLARAAGHDGLILQNIMDQGWSDDLLPPATTYAALKRGTVYSPVTGDLLYANAPTGAALPVGMEASQQDQDPALLDYLAAIGLYELQQTQRPSNQMPAPPDLDIKLQDLIDRGVDPLERFRLGPERREDPNAPRPWFRPRG